jgi:dimethylhistidine N-methyltransferase
MTPHDASTRLSLSVSDQTPVHREFHEAVVAGLSAPEKTLPTRFLYDRYGSELFDEICRLPEYYLTRSEQEIMDRYAAEMAEAIGDRALIVEYGSGASQKTRNLLEHLHNPAAYVPLDISKEFLLESARSIDEAFPDLEVLPLAADFTRPFQVPRPNQQARRTVVYFPGSTIGNFTPSQAEHMLHRIASIVGRNGALLIGIDLRKDESILHAAYNDSAGVTKRFILNILVRMQRELGAELDVDSFHYEGRWNSDVSRIELTVSSDRKQTIRIGRDEFALERHEPILVEYSYKYDNAGFAELARRAGLEQMHHWPDSNNWFSVRYLEARE